MKKAIIVYIAIMALYCFAVTYHAVNYHDTNSILLPESSAPVEDDPFYIDLNKATIDELQNIPGVGYQLAENIVTYRNLFGDFKDYADLLNVEGIGKNKLVTIMKYARIK